MDGDGGTGGLARTGPRPFASRRDLAFDRDVAPPVTDFRNADAAGWLRVKAIAEIPGETGRAVAGFPPTEFNWAMKSPPDWPSPLCEPPENSPSTRFREVGDPAGAGHEDIRPCDTARRFWMFTTTVSVPSVAGRIASLVIARGVCLASPIQAKP